MKDLQMLYTLATECATFFQQAGTLPLVKNVAPRDAFRKIKIRHKQISSEKAAINTAFDQSIVQRSLIACGIDSYQLPPREMILSQRMHYVFPLDGFKFIYNPHIRNEKDIGIQGNINDTELAEDVVRFSFADSDLAFGIECGAQVMIYDIPAYYAVDASEYDYEDILTGVRQWVDS
jgi:hypothetical protein